MNRLLLFASFLGLMPCLAAGQTDTLRGKVLAGDTGEPLAFATVQLLQAGRGAVADLDGIFAIPRPAGPDTLRVSYLGYEPRAIPLKSLGNGPVTIRLQPKDITTEEVVITPGINPAHRLIRAAIRNRSRNDPENMESFAYESYNKLKMRSIPLDDEDGPSVEDIYDAHFFLWESVTRRRFQQPNNSYENVLISRMSGAKDYPLPFSPTDFQDLSFYQNWVDVMGTNFYSPIARKAINKYSYQLYDTVLTERGDSIFSIQFRPKDDDFNGFEGTMKLHSAYWTIKSIRAELRKAKDQLQSSFMSSALIQQIHAPINDSVWFPKQLFTDLRADSNLFSIVVNDTLENDSVVKVRATMGVEVRSYLRKIHTDTSFRRRDFGEVVVEVDPDALDRPDERLQSLREIKLDSVEANTYTRIDSVSDELKLEERINLVMKLGQGLVPVGPVDLPITRFYRFNDVENHRVGLGAQTNEKISRNYSLGGWFGYGTGDKEWKFGGKLALHPFRNRGIRLQLSYMDDLQETGGERLAYSPTDRLFQQPYEDDEARYFYLQQMHYTNRYGASVFFPSIRYLDHRLELRHEWQDPAFNYSFQGQRFIQLTEFRATTRWAPGETYVATPQRRFRQPNENPVVYVRYTRGLDGTLDGEFGYDLLEATLSETFNLPGLGSLNYHLAGGWAWGDVPITRLFSFRAAGSPNIIFVKDGLNAMDMHRFRADRFASGAVNLRIKNHDIPYQTWSPDPVLHVGAAYGELTLDSEANREIASPQHQGVPFFAPSDGYYEAGLSLRYLLPDAVYLNTGVLGNMLRSTGLSTFYRFGPATSGPVADNLRFMLRVEVLGFGS